MVLEVERCRDVKVAGPQWRSRGRFAPAEPRSFQLQGVWARALFHWPLRLLQTHRPGADLRLASLDQNLVPSDL